MRFLLIAGLLSYLLLVTVALPRWLSRADWLASAPRTAIAAWLALAFSAVMSALQAALIVEFPDLPASMSPAAIRDCLVLGLRAQYSTLAGAIAGSLAATIALGITVRIVWCTAAICKATSVSRERVGGTVAVARPGPAPGTLVLDDDRPAVYCLPGQRHIVLTTGALRSLQPIQLKAVLGHESAHLAGRHHVVLTCSAILAAAFPGIPLFARAAAEIGNMVEMAADDAAARAAGSLSLAQALLTLAAAQIPGDAIGATGSCVAQRIRRLIEPVAPTRRVAVRLTRWAVLGATALTLLTMPAVAAIVRCCSGG
jgi:hypothetical protein